MKKHRGKNLIPDIKHLRSLCRLLGKFGIIYYYTVEEDTWCPETKNVITIKIKRYGIGLREAKNFMEGIYEYDGIGF